MAGRVLQLLGPRPPGAPRHVGFLTDELEIVGWHVEVAGPRGVMREEGHLDHVVDLTTAGVRSARRHLRMLAGRVDIVHAHGRDAAGLAVGSELGVPVVWTCYGEEVDGPNRADRRLSRRVAAVIAATPSVAERTHERAYVEVIRPAVGPPHPVRARAEVRAGLGVDGGQPIVLAYGPLVEGAGLEVVLDAAIFLQQDGPALRVVVVGEGPLERELRTRIGELGLVGAVSVSVPVAASAEVLAAADLFVVPSPVPADEGVVLDAMALGIPVVSVHGAVAASLVEDGATGVVVPPAHARALASAIADLFARPERMVELAEAGRRRAEELNDPERLVEAVASVYRRVAP